MVKSAIRHLGAMGTLQGVPLQFLPSLGRLGRISYGEWNTGAWWPWDVGRMGITSRGW